MITPPSGKGTKHRAARKGLPPDCTRPVPDALTPAQKAMLAAQARRSVEGNPLAEVEEAREAAVVKLDTLDEVLEEMRA